MDKKNIPQKEIEKVEIPGQKIYLSLEPSVASPNYISQILILNDGTLHALLSDASVTQLSISKQSIR